MRIVFAVLLVAHGVAHLPGFLVSWQLQSFPELPYRTTIVGGSIDVGSSGIRAIGLAWLASSVMFGIAAAAALMQAPWWQSLVLTAVGLSTTLCLAGWPDARLGLVANAVILVIVAIGIRAGWL